MRSTLKALIPAPVRRWLLAGNRVHRLEAELAATKALLERAATDLRSFVQAEVTASRVRSEDQTRSELATSRREIEDRLEAVRAIAEEVVSGRLNLLSGRVDAIRDRVLALEKIPECLDILAGRGDDTLIRVDALETLTSRLTVRARQHRQIDLIAYGDVRLFMFTDDAGYENIPPDLRNQSCVPVDLVNVPAGADNLTVVLLAHYWENGLDPWVLDVGANYGFESIYTARLLRAAERAGRVIAFEPGVAAALLPHSVALNGIADRVRVESVAVGSYTGPGLLFGEDGHSENNRIVNRWDPDGWANSRIAQVDTLDAYTERNGITADLIVKVDTQGAEPEVLDGMDRLLRDRVTTLVIEFFPCGMRRRTTPEEFLTRLARHGTILDLNQQGPLTPIANGLPIVSERDYPGFIEAVIARSCEWSDLLVVPYNLPNRDALLARLTAGLSARAAA